MLPAGRLPPQRSWGQRSYHSPPVPLQAPAQPSMRPRALRQGYGAGLVLKHPLTLPRRGQAGVLEEPFQGGGSCPAPQAGLDSEGPGQQAGGISSPTWGVPRGTDQHPTSAGPGPASPGIHPTLPGAGAQTPELLLTGRTCCSLAEAGESLLRGAAAAGGIPKPQTEVRRQLDQPGTAAVLHLPRQSWGRGSVPGSGGPGQLRS